MFDWLHPKPAPAPSQPAPPLPQVPTVPPDDALSALEELRGHRGYAVLLSLVNAEVDRRKEALTTDGGERERGGIDALRWICGRGEYRPLVEREIERLRRERKRAV